MNLNRLDISGRITTDISKGGSFMSFTCKQRLSEKASLIFDVKCFGEAAIRFNETGLQKGDEVAIIGGVIYYKDNKVTVKVKKLAQIFNISERKESLDLGTEKFM